MTATRIEWMHPFVQDMLGKATTSFGIASHPAKALVFPIITTRASSLGSDRPTCAKREVALLRCNPVVFLIQHATYLGIDLVKYGHHFHIAWSSEYRRPSKLSVLQLYQITTCLVSVCSYALEGSVSFKLETRDPLATSSCDHDRLILGSTSS